MCTGDKNAGGNICDAKVALIKEQSAVATLQPIALALRSKVSSNRKLLIQRNR